ncbi:hypothetical protein [Burkholderia pseudomallei]|uniref:hypothetical protein n=1 Tax=Burkholderia pseudomallei TaxID=28450 RepID=UPI001E6544D1|nr:hypothetical protein [Burkholderia pseudomallei]
MSKKKWDAFWLEHFDCEPFNFFRDAKQLPDIPGTFAIGRLLIELLDLPKFPNGHVCNAEAALTEFFQLRADWQRDLPYFRGPFSFHRENGQTCVVKVLNRREPKHIRVRQTRNRIAILLPHPRQWIRSGLGWLFEPPCPCGDQKCIPAPWRNTVCRNGWVE